MSLERLQGFIDAAGRALLSHVTEPRAEASVRMILEDLQETMSSRPALRKREAPRLPVCARLAESCAPERFPNRSLQELADALLAVEPDLTWYERRGELPGANAAYRDGHANTMIAGPGGLLPHQRVWLGVSLLAPHVRYPDHTHPPEETYLVLSDGEFFQEGRGWFAPGVGGSFYNPPGILHAMRSGEGPLLAMWALRAG